MPFVIEAYGRLGDAATTLVRMLAPLGGTRSAVISELYQDLSCTLQRASADTVMAANPAGAAAVTAQAGA